jgi:hypothetical protein
MVIPQKLAAFKEKARSRGSWAADLKSWTDLFSGIKADGFIGAGAQTTATD